MQLTRSRKSATSPVSTNPRPYRLPPLRRENSRSRTRSHGSTGVAFENCPAALVEIQAKGAELVAERPIHSQLDSRVDRRPKVDERRRVSSATKSPRPGSFTHRIISHMVSRSSNCPREHGKRPTPSRTRKFPFAMNDESTD